ncbi:MAG TPA: hypothetical protein VHF05_00615 [Candidatus Paceibacterota bacterium]|nr:hypothetical protein [Candidatus Paceibacterota bacterium]
MKILSVYPISRGISKEKLSYFSSEDHALGSIISVPLRKRSVPAIVVGSADAETQKTEIRSSDFALRKIGATKSRPVFSSAFIRACERMADYSAASPGAVLSAMIPKTILDHLEETSASALEESEGAHEKLVMQAGDEERFSHYKSLIREEFARKRSVFFMLPTVEDVRRMKPQLEKGIEEYSFALHGNLTPKKIRDAWDKARESSHPILVIATPQFLSLPRSDLRTIIVEEEASRTYRGVSRPYIDGRLFAEFFAEESHARLILGDVLLQTETLWKKMNDEYVDLIPLKFRSLSSAEARIVDMREEADEEKKRFRIFSDELERLILSTKENNERLFLFGARKGYAGSTVCADCGEIVRCNNCGAPVAVYMLNADEGYFYCNKCGERRDAKERCTVCDSWNLTMLGVGVERIEDELRKRFPDIQVFRLDKESVSTEKKALEIAEKFRETPGSVLVGTELALIYMREIAENAAVVSIDTLFAVPDFRINEKLFHILLQIRSLAEKRFIIQTRNIGEKIFQYAVQGNLMDFYRDEIAMRKQFQYPPWSLFVKVSLEGPRASVEAEMRKLQKFLEPFQADVLTSFDSPSAKRHQMHGLIKVKAQEWPNPALLEKLRALPPTFKIKVDPDTLI